MIQIDLRGPRLHIRRARLEDAATSFRWFSNPDVTRYLPLAGTAILPLLDIEQYLARVATTDRPELAVGIDLNSGEPVGCGGFRNFHEEEAELSLILGEPAQWGQGLGAEAMELLLAFAFGPLKLTRVWLIVRADNTRALSLFQRCGFIVVERQIGVVVVDGTPRDKFRMELRGEVWQQALRSRH
jgi:RimJ/RimL family protein N-acetyltransferase